MLVILGSKDGKATIGETLLAKTGGIRFNTAQPVRFQWLRDGAAIPDENQRQYIVTGEDLGRHIGLRFMYNGDRMARADKEIFVTDKHIEAVRALYPYAFGREPDMPGLLFWGAYLRGMVKPKDPVSKLEKLMQEFRTSPTYQESRDAAKL